MAHFHIKTKKGRPYLYVREIARVDGKPKVISQIYLGSPEKVAGLLGGKEAEVLDLKVEEFGSLWLAQQIDRDIDLCGIVDNVVPRAERETGPTVGEYFLYCVLNRMVQAVSKNQLADWFRKTAIQQIRPVELDELTSKRYWEKWERVSETALQTIASRFFERIWQVEAPSADCLLFDTTNYYTYMASQTDSKLAQRGKNKAGKHHLRQIGLGLLVARDSRLPLYYSVYPGNIHDSKHFEAVMDEMFGVVCGLNKTKERLTVVIDKGMNADTNYAWIDDHPRIHFITTYSTYFAQELAATPLDRFEPADTAENRRYIKEGYEEECLLVYRTRVSTGAKSEPCWLPIPRRLPANRPTPLPINLRPCARSYWRCGPRSETRPRSGERRRQFANGMSDFASRSIWNRNCTNWNSANPLMACR